MDSCTPNTVGRLNLHQIDALAERAMTKIKIFSPPHILELCKKHYFFIRRQAHSSDNLFPAKKNGMLIKKPLQGQERCARVDFLRRREEQVFDQTPQSWYRVNCGTFYLHFKINSVI